MQLSGPVKHILPASRSAASVRLVFDGEVEAHDAAGSGEPEVALVEVQVVHAGA